MHVKNMIGVGKQGEQWLPFKYEAAKILYYKANIGTAVT